MFSSWAALRRLPRFFSKALTIIWRSTSFNDTASSTYSSGSGIHPLLWLHEPQGKRHPADSRLLAVRQPGGGRPLTLHPLPVHQLFSSVTSLRKSKKYLVQQLAFVFKTVAFVPFVSTARCRASPDLRGYNRTRFQE